MKDKFVLEESALDAFPLDEHEYAPGNHEDVVKPDKVGILPFEILKKRLLRGTPTTEEHRVVNGESEEAVEFVNRVRAAIEVEDAETLMNIAADLVKEAPTMPTVERMLGLHLARWMHYEQAVVLLQRVLRFKMSDGRTPFAGDIQTVQQLAVALSALDRNTEALTCLESLPVEAKNCSETMGIRAGRIKREWWKKPEKSRLARRALDLYQAAYESAQSAGNIDQVLYNGINVVYIRFELGLPHQDVAKAVLAVAAEPKDSDYWAHATRAEAHLLLSEFTEATECYKAAFGAALEPRKAAREVIYNGIDLSRFRPGTDRKGSDAVVRDQKGS